jgi:Site-specific recombinases, DNA invertase Pin homologs
MTNKCKAVFYCRVSTEEESQKNALIDQVEEAKKAVINNDWNLVDSYIDEGKSGTSTKHRDEYNRLFNDLETDKFDIIVVKSQDRLMRNTKEWYIFVDKLLTCNKKLFFYLDNKFYSPDDALITGFKAMLAEEYSRDLSKKINNAHRNRQETGKSVVITSSTWGYDKINNEVVVNEKEAEIIRLIFNLYLEGKGSRTISKELTDRGIRSRTGGYFPDTTIRRIIRNPLFMGDVVMNKRHYDFNRKETIHIAEENWIIHKDKVPAIVTREVWEKANEIMDRRSVELRTEEDKVRKQGVKMGKYALSGKIICGECGNVFHRKYRKNKRTGEEIISWTCSEYIKRGRKTRSGTTRGNQQLLSINKNANIGCDNRCLIERDLFECLRKIGENNFNDDKDSIVEDAIIILKSVLEVTDFKVELEKIRNEKDKVMSQKDFLMDKLLDEIISDRDYQVKNSILDDKLTAIEDKEKDLKRTQLREKNIDDRIKEITDFLNSNQSTIDIDTLIDRIEKIDVFQTYFIIYFDFFKIVRVNITGNAPYWKYSIET